MIHGRSAGKAVLCGSDGIDSGETDASAATRAPGLLAHVDTSCASCRAAEDSRDVAARRGRVRQLKFLFRSDMRASAARGWNWWSDQEAGGGVLGAIGSHAVDTLSWLTGARVSHVSALLATHVAERTDEEGGAARAVTSDDEADMLLHFAGGATDAHATARRLSVVEPGGRKPRAVFGRRGALMLESAASFPPPVGEAGAQKSNRARALAAGCETTSGRALNLFARGSRRPREGAA